MVRAVLLVAVSLVVPFLTFMAGASMTGAGHGTGDFLVVACPAIVLMPTFAVVYLLTRRSSNGVISLLPVLIQLFFEILVLGSLARLDDRTRLAFTSFPLEIGIFWALHLVTVLLPVGILVHWFRHRP